MTLQTLRRNYHLIVFALAIGVFLAFLFPNTPSELPPISIENVSAGLTGVGEHYLLNRTETYIDEWNGSIPKLKKWKFRTVRLEVVFSGSPYLDSRRTNVLDYNKLDEILKLFDANGLKAIVDFHNSRDMYNYVGSQEWIDGWVEFAQRYKGDTRITAYELISEPSPGTWALEITSTDDLARAFARTVDAIREIDPNRTIVWPVSRAHFSEVQPLPPDAVRPNVIYAFHAGTRTSEWVGAVEAAEDLEEAMADWKQLYPDAIVWLGELGIYQEEDPDAQEAFVSHLIDWCVRNNVDFSLWYYLGHSQLTPLYDLALSEADYDARGA